MYKRKGNIFTFPSNPSNPVSQSHPQLRLYQISAPFSGISHRYYPPNFSPLQIIALFQPPNLLGIPLEPEGHSSQSSRQINYRTTLPQFLQSHPPSLDPSSVVHHLLQPCLILCPHSQETKQILVTFNPSFATSQHTYSCCIPIPK